MSIKKLYQKEEKKMAKKVIGEDGKTYTMKEKNLFIKKFGFGYWLLLF